MSVELTNGHYKKGSINGTRLKTALMVSGALHPQQERGL